jgi:multimeric flavodoxin WrbA
MHSRRPAEDRRRPVVVFLTPVTFGGYSSELKEAVDRLIPLVLPCFRTIDGEVHHVRRYDRYPSLLGLGLLPEPDAEQERIFRAVIERNAINMHAPSFGVSYLYEGDQDASAAIVVALSEVIR